MISRRDFTAFLSLFSALLTWRPVRAMAAHETTVLTGISPRLAATADAWFEAGIAYERARTGFHADGQPGLWRVRLDPEGPEQLALRTAVANLTGACRLVLREPAQTAEDVILKYHVIDMQYGHWPVDDWAWAAVDGDALYHEVLRESERFGVRINPFWLGAPPLQAEIDGDRHSPRWETVSRWRTPKYQSIV